jgi:hypothetical protein
MIVCNNIANIKSFNAWKDFQGYLGSISLGSSPSGENGKKGSVACPIF